MSRTITLNVVRVLQWTFDPVSRSVQVQYELVDTTGRGREGGMGVFFATLPANFGITPEGVVIPLPGDYYELGETKMGKLDDVHAGIIARLTRILD
jgi:hypothetical protein